MEQKELLPTKLLKCTVFIKKLSTYTAVEKMDVVQATFLNM